MTEKERFNSEGSRIYKLIAEEEKLIREAQGRIYHLKIQAQNHERSCNHKYDNGETALKRDYEWISSPSTYIHSWTGEEVEEDNGHTHYYEICLICDRRMDE